MKLRVVILVLLAFGAALGTVYFARNWMDAQRAAMSQAPAPPPPAHNEILVAKEDLPAGTLLKPDQLVWQPWPEGGLESTYIKKEEHTPEEYAGSVVREGVRAGQPVSEAVLVKPGDSGFLARHARGLGRDQRDDRRLGLHLPGRSCGRDPDADHPGSPRFEERASRQRNGAA